MGDLDGFILAAGLGTRMGPLSRVLPKPAWTLRGRPLLLWGADGMRDAGLERIACNAHHLPEKLKAVAGNALEVCPEPVLLGSAGGLRHDVALLEGGLAGGVHGRDVGDVVRQRVDPGLVDAHAGCGRAEGGER